MGVSTAKYPRFEDYAVLPYAQMEENCGVKDRVRVTSTIAMSEVQTQDIEKNVSKESVPDEAPCPYWLMMIPYVLTFVFFTFFSWKFIDTKPIQWHFPVVAYVFAGFCVLHWCYLLGERWYFYGPAGFYEIYWYCSLALLFTAAAVVLKLPSLIAECMCLTLFPHISFWIDAILTPICGHEVIGSAGWLYDKETPWHERISTFHHFWFFPCIFIVLYGQPPIPIQGYILSIVQFVVLNFFAHFMTPNVTVDKNGEIRKLNICVSHVAPDFLLNIPPFSWGTRQPYLVFLLVATLCYNVPFNYVAFFICEKVQQLVNMI